MTNERDLVKTRLELSLGWNLIGSREWY